jgi:hypothetical protein
MEKNYSEQESLNQFIAFLQDHFKHVNEEKGYIDLGPNGNEALKRAVYEFFCRYINKVKNHDYCFKLEGVCRKNNQPCILEEKSTGHISHECCWIIENKIALDDYLNLEYSEFFLL